jgi:hypothetical protein
MYEHILEKHSHEGKWLFIHYNQAFLEASLNQLRNFTEAPVDCSFPDANFHRNCVYNPVPRKTQKIYQRLCQLAKYNDINYI